MVSTVLQFIAFTQKGGDSNRNWV